MTRTYCVYTLASRSRNVYTGVTNNLERRMIEDRQGLIPGFTSRYKVFRLVHFEEFGDIRDAIAREKEIKGWRREKKIRLIEQHNPTWADLADRLPSYGGGKADPHTVRKRREQVRDGGTGAQGHRGGEVNRLSCGEPKNYCGIRASFGVIRTATISSPACGRQGPRVLRSDAQVESKTELYERSGEISA